MSAHAIAAEPALYLDLAEMPEPVRQCDGSWRVPLWTPDEGWLLSTYDPDGLDVAASLRPRAQCPDRDECTALHEEDFTPAELIMMRARE